MKPAIRKLGTAIAWRFALPFAWLWLRLHQRRILHHGRELTDKERRFAEKLGIKDCDKVRLWSVDQVPSPGGFLLSGLGRLAGVSTHSAKGMALDHGIYLESAQDSRPSLVAHELVHVAQFERLGGTWLFLRDYLRQCLEDGYWNAPLEIEARERAEEIVG
jgi:hypothetical protein